ncbi:hypothetical protein DEU56DRAFT_330436 [Suillus clintonianus]|uniref:uncharacterized protein n=1 Tax=Suillus clintonianus TaxID=1904413 RepID=UPI001B870BB3|nr:uncharacterized protein DEU56DRAFT_330436 [Suillus clintonianus]KAG2138984.1 hypothetical protein DEU56DRAFT_330436 [Suillus clintonianus]
MLSTMKAFGKKSMKVLCEIHALSFSHSSSSAKVTPYIHRLPVEILEQVFLLIVQSAPGCSNIFLCGRDTISVDVASPPLVLTRVCRRWRVVAHSTPGVWSRIQVILPGQVKSFKPSIPHLLQCWLARSGSLPLALHIVTKPRSRRKHPCTLTSAANYRLLYILLAERKRWETVVMPDGYDWNLDFDTPQLRTLACHWSNFSEFNAPNLVRLSISSHCFPVTPTCKDLRHLYLQTVSARTISSTIAIFPHLETIVVDIISYGDDPASRSVSATLESMTLPLPPFMSDTDFRNEFIDMFSQLHLPVLRKLTLAGLPQKGQVKCLLAALGVAPFQVPVVDFQTDAPLSKAQMNNIAPLFSIVGEVTLYGELAQINEYRHSRMEKLKLCFSR